MRPTLLLLLTLTACGETASTTPPPSAPTPEPPVEPAVPPTPPPPPVEIPAIGPRTLSEGTVYTGDVGGIVRHGDVLVRFGDAEPFVLGIAERARCAVIITESRRDLPAGSWSSIQLTTTPASAADAAWCARFAGTFGNGHPSDPRAGGPPPPPTFPGSECLLLPQLVSMTGMTCATFRAPADGASATAPYAVDVYTGNCCSGAPTRTSTAPGEGIGFMLTDDGQTLVVQVRDPFVPREELAADPVMLVVVAASGTRELHVRELLEADPVLAEGTGFSLQVRFEQGALFARVAGGTEHRHAL